MPEKYLSETQGKPSIKLYCFTLDTPPESRALLGSPALPAPRGKRGLGSGEESLRHRGESCSTPRRKLLCLYIDSQYITGSLFSTSDST